MLKHLKGRFFGLAEIFADSERKAWGFASFAERTVSRDWKQSTWG